ncbi:hypothetical protein D9M71_624530 [compost metagenome]
MENVEGRTATVGAVRLAALVELGQGALEVAGRHAQQRHHPHPEHRAGAAEHDGHGHTGDVARAYAAGNREHQRLKTAQLAFLALQCLAEDAEHVAEIAELHEAGTDGEEQSETDEDDDQQLAPEEIVKDIEHDDSPDPV